MKGDFSRSTFDSRKHYTSVRMQQGRVQLDADWNEQADILLHLVTTQLRDLLGPSGTTINEPGFAITLEPSKGPTAPARTSPDLRVGAGRYYVHGILCENDVRVPFSGQPDYPVALSLLRELIDHDHLLVYLDVWQRHITAVQDPAIREVALGGPDTATRVKTVWQVKLLPLSGDPADDPGWRDRGGLRSLADWQDFVAGADDKGRLQARWQGAGQAPENRLYRVEVHSVSDDQATFKWSRENGSVVFPVTAIHHSKTLLWPREYGSVVLPVTPIDEDTLCLTVEGLERDPYLLPAGSWVELVDDVTVLSGRPLPLCQVQEVDRANARVTLRKDRTSQVLAEIGGLMRHPLLRRWEDDIRPVVPSENAAGGLRSRWSDLENGIQVAFRETGSYQVGDYWLIPARARSEDGIEWPQEGGQPLAQAPHGIVHHYAPLALLQFRDGAWCVTSDDATFDTLPQLRARLDGVSLHLRDYVRDSARLGQRVTVLEQRQPHCEAPLVQYFRRADEICAGHVVSVIPRDPSDDTEGDLSVRLTSAENKRDRRLVVGVATEVGDGGEDRDWCRVVVYGPATCKVIGEIEPGDLLVPSVRPGYAQKAGRRPTAGTILGKALGSSTLDDEARENLEEGERPGQIRELAWTGTVEMMITLH